VEDATQAVWIYDLRTGAPAYGKTKPLEEEDFAAFSEAFGHDPLGQTPRVDGGETGRFRRFTREQLAERNDNLDITWLKDTSGDPEDGLTEPDDIAVAILGHLRAALEEIEAVADELAETNEVRA
jgi:type I restriction enzyme M protein